MKIQIKCLDKFKPLITKKKRVKIIVGGRASTKTTFVADYVLACMANGQLWCCGREFQNSIDESVHRTLLDEIDRLEIPGYRPTKASIEHLSGGRNFYRGLSRNILSLKGLLSGVDGLWVEEGEGLSDETLRVMTASTRATARDFDAAKKAGIPISDMRTPEIWITMNRGSMSDPISKRYLERAEPDLERCQYYEDDEVIIVEANYHDMPRDWFLASGLEEERQSDKKLMTRHQYDHKWLGKYLEAVEDTIIQPEWFDACIDAHIKLGFKPTGAKVAAHDPADSGDAKAHAIRHGSVFTDIRETTIGDVNQACDWSLDLTIIEQADAFVWDSIGIGLSLKRQIDNALHGKKIEAIMFGAAEIPYSPDSIYEPADKTEIKEPKKNRDIFANKRAQCYWRLKDRMYKTYRAVEHGEYIDPDELISFCSTIENMSKLRSEVCRIPRKRHGNGKIQLMSKKEMISKGIPSPNMADCAMMTLADYHPAEDAIEINFDSPW